MKTVTLCEKHSVLLYYILFMLQTLNFAVGLVDLIRYFSAGLINSILNISLRRMVCFIFGFVVKEYE